MNDGGGASGEAVTAPPARSRARRLAGLAAGLAILVFLAYSVVDSWSVVRDFDWRMRPAPLAAAIVVLAGFYATSGAAYARIVRLLEPDGPPGAVTVSVWARSLLGRYVPGNVLMIVGRVVLARERGTSRRVTLAATAYEQVLALVVAAIAAVAFVALSGEIGGRWGLALLLLVPLGLAALHPKVFGPASTWVLARFGRAPLPSLLSARQLGGLCGWYAAAAALLGLGVWLSLYAAVGSQAGGPAYVGAAFLLSFVLSVVAFIFPSGLGVREGVFAAALTANVPGGVAVALAVGSRLLLTLVELVFVGAMVLWDRRR